MSSPDLLDLARRFAGEVTDLLNGTVTDGVRLGAAINRSTGKCIIAPGVTPKSFVPIKLVPLQVGRGQPCGYLMAVFTAQLDPEAVHLTVNKSQFGLYLDRDGRKMLLHYDYERAPTHGYPAAHVQVDGTSKTLQSWCQQAKCAPRPLKKLHLPVGGRRFRPTLEDVIEFAVLEGLVKPREGWQKVVEKHRSRWLQRQLRAAVRRDPASAVAELRDAGYEVIPPPDD